ncbi:MAG: dihydropyrimidinase/dihydroorotase/allantoinase [Dinoroseobacter sp.]
MFEGRRLRGRVMQTILKGNTVFLNGKVIGPQGGGGFVTPAIAT